MSICITLFLLCIVMISYTQLFWPSPSPQVIPKNRHWKMEPDQYVKNIYGYCCHLSQELEEKDEGWYACVARNSHGNASKKAYLDVRSKFQIRVGRFITWLGKVGELNAHRMFLGIMGSLHKNALTLIPPLETWFMQWAKCLSFCTS